MGTRREAARAMANKVRMFMFENTFDGTFGPNTYPARRARRYHPDYADWKGVPLQPVDMRLTGDHLNTMLPAHTIDGQFLNAFVRWDTERGRRLHRWIAEQGVGRNRIIRDYLFLTPDQVQEVWDEGFAVLTRT